MQKNRLRRGFSLIELLIVVAIILIIAAIAIPNLMRARMAANESSAVGSLRTINTGEITYNSTYSTVGYATALSNLGGGLGAACVPSSSTACLIDSGDERSISTHVAWGIPLAACSSLDTSRAPSTTRAPASARDRAHARPMPRLAPVTNAVLFFIRS